MYMDEGLTLALHHQRAAELRGRADRYRLARGDRVRHATRRPWWARWRTTEAHGSAGTRAPALP